MSVLSILHYIDMVLGNGGWVAILVIDWYLDNRHRARMDRGKHRRWARRFCGRMFGLFGEVMGHTLIFLVLAFGLVIPVCVATDSTMTASVFWLYILAVDIYDFITGGEDPPWRRWLASLSKKLVIQPPPRPVIDVGR